MEIVLNTLILDEAQREAFVRAMPGYRQIFAPDGRMPDGSPVPPEMYLEASVILGNPPPEAFAGSTRLRLLQTRTAGLERYLKPGALPPQTVLAGCSGAWGVAVAEHMFAMLLSLLKRLPEFYGLQQQARWQALGQEKTLRGATVLCVGTGDLGSSIARHCKAFGAHTVGLRRNAGIPAEGIDEMHGMEELDRLLPLADVVCLTLPHAADTTHIMDLRRMRMMKPDAILLNGGRGTAVDCGALAEVLASGHLRGAALDVTDPEPLPADHLLWRQERVLLTPHTGGGLPEITFRLIAEIALENMKRYVAGEPLRNQAER